MSAVAGLTPLIVALLLGASVALAFYALRRRLRLKWLADVAWANDMMWRFTPEPRDMRPLVAAAYIAYTVLFGVLVLFAPTWWIGIGLWVVLLFVPRIVFNYAWEKRRKKIDEQLPGAVLQMSNAVGSGMSLIQAIDRLAERAEEPIRTEFRVISNQWKYGSDLIAAIEEAKRRLSLPNFSLFSSSLTINQQMGGNVVETMQRIAHSLESIHEMKHEVYTSTSEGRTNIKVLAAAPLLMLGLIAFIDAEAVGMLFTHPAGQIILGIAFAMTAAGVYLAWRVVNADV